MNNRLGEVKLNTYGTPMKIIAYRGYRDIDVEFQDEYKFIRERTSYANFQRGHIWNPYDKTVCNMGYLGEGEHCREKDGVVEIAYVTWHDIIYRCYGNQKNYPAYYNKATICQEWLNLQVFADWYDANKYDVDERLHIDKDILHPGNKVYSPENCLLVPQRINVLFINKRNKRGLPNGIRKANGRYYAQYDKVELGSSSTIKGAFEFYRKAKETKIKQTAQEYKHIVPTKVYDALMNYEVKIENDKNYSITKIRTNDDFI